MLSGAPQLLNINEVVYFILLLLSPFDWFTYLFCINCWRIQACEYSLAAWVFCVPWKVPRGLSREGHIETYFAQIGKLGMVNVLINWFLFVKWNLPQFV
jgi:hypothetical protein